MLYQKHEVYRKRVPSLCDFSVEKSARDKQIQTIKIEKETIIKTASLHDDDQRSEFIIYWQAGDMNIRDYSIMGKLKNSGVLGRIFLDLLVSIMEEPCFDFLRTKKTLGYSVFPMIRCTYGIIGCWITVRSQIDKFTAEQVMEAVQEFLVSFKKQLKAMKPAEFKGKF